MVKRENVGACTAVVVLMALLLTAAGCRTSYVQAQDATDTGRQVEQAVDNRELRIEVNSMTTQRYGSHRIASDFYLLLRGDTLESRLPFLGRVHTPSYNSPSQGLDFISAVRDFRRTTTKRGGVRIEMKVKSDEDRYFYQVDISPNGKASIQVLPQERDAVSFDGEVAF